MKEMCNFFYINTRYCVKKVFIVKNMTQRVKNKYSK